jgi:hypothetical protein
MLSVSLGAALPLAPLVLLLLVLPPPPLAAVPPHAVRQRAATARALTPMRLKWEPIIEASRSVRAGRFRPACREGWVAQPALGRNDAIQWNAIVVIVSMVRIVAFAEAA